MLKISLFIFHYYSNILFSSNLVYILFLKILIQLKKYQIIYFRFLMYYYYYYYYQVRFIIYNIQETYNL